MGEEARRGPATHASEPAGLPAVWGGGWSSFGCYGPLVPLMALPKGAQRGVKSHRHEVSRHPVRDCVERFAEVFAYVGQLVQVAQLQAVPDSLGDLGRRDLLVPCPICDGIHEPDRAADALGRGGAAHFYCASGRGPTTTRRSGSSPMLELETSGSPSSARWIARRSKACMASSVMASPVIFT